MQIFIIPGNPPALHFYKLWAEEIQREYSECSVHISPYQRLPRNNNSFEYLRDIAAIHGKELLAFHKTSKDKIVVIGHSLGAWMALHILEEYTSIIEDCLLLFPFLRKPSLKGRVILKSMQLLHKTPLVENMLLGSRSILEKFFRDLKFVTDEELGISLILASHEHKVIGNCNKSLQIPDQVQDKLHMLYCDQDIWCPSHIINKMKDLISCEKADTTHGFITSAQERATVLKALLNRTYHLVPTAKKLKISSQP